MAVLRAVLMFVLIGWSFQLGAAGQTVVIWMKNGDRLTGSIMQQDKDRVFFDLPYAGQLLLARNQIERIEHPLPPEDAAVPAKGQTEAVNVQKHPATGYSVDLTAGKKRSNSRTDNLGFKTTFEQRDDKLRLTFDGKYDYETSNSLKKTHKYLLNPGADYFFQPQLFWRTKVDYSQDFIATDYRNTDLSSGVGYSFFDTAELRVEFIALAGLKRTHFKETAGLEIFIGDRQSLDFRHAQLEWDLRYLWPQSSFEIFSEGSYLKPVNQPVNFIKFGHEIDVSSGLHYYLTERVRLSFSVDFDWSDIDVVLNQGLAISVDSRELHQKLSIGAKF